MILWRTDLMFEVEGCQKLKTVTKGGMGGRGGGAGPESKNRLKNGRYVTVERSLTYSLTVFSFLESSCTSISAFSELTNGIGKPQSEDHFFK